MIFNRWQCWIKRIWWRINGGVGDGHYFEDQEVHHNKSVVIAKCKFCGKTDFMWGDKHLLDN